MESPFPPQPVLSGQCLCCALCRFPNLKSVRELILKRGQAKIKEKTVPLTDNTVIEEHLGEHRSLGVAVTGIQGVCILGPDSPSVFLNCPDSVMDKGIYTLLLFREIWCHLLGRPHPRNCLPWEAFPGDLFIPVPFPPLCGPSCY